MDQGSESSIVSGVPPPKPRLLDQVRATIRGKHYSRRTEKTYIHWIKRFIYFTGKRHPAEMGAPEVTAFLNDLATERNVAAATQNQALSALLFLYQHLLRHKLPWLDDMVRAKRPVRLPAVLSDEVRMLLAQLDGAKWLMASLLHEQGRTLSEKPARSRRPTPPRVWRAMRGAVPQQTKLLATY